MTTAFAVTNVIGKQAKGCFGFTCGILAGVALASTIAIFQSEKEKQSRLERQHLYLRTSYTQKNSSARTLYAQKNSCARTSYAQKKSYAHAKKKPCKKTFTKRKIRFADEVDKPLVYVREFVKGSPINAQKKKWQTKKNSRRRNDIRKKTSNRRNYKRKNPNRYRTYMITTPPDQIWLLPRPMNYCFNLYYGTKNKVRLWESTRATTTYKSSPHVLAINMMSRLLHLAPRSPDFLVRSCRQYIHISAISVLCRLGALLCSNHCRWK